MGQRWIVTGPSGPDTFEFVRYSAPEPGPGQAKVRVTAAAMNPMDIYPPHSVAPAALPQPVGREGTGIVEAVGRGVTAADGTMLEVGDPVIIYTLGTWSTEMTVGGPSLVHRPPTLDEQAAAGLLIAGLTAADLVHTAQVRPGDTVLITAASGAVGTSAIQQAFAAGATRVLGTSSPDHAEILRGFGAEYVEFGQRLVRNVRDVSPSGVDLVLDIAGDTTSIDAAQTLLGEAYRQRLVTVMAFGRAATDGFRALGRTEVGHRWRRDQRTRLVAMAAAGKLEVPIARTFPLSAVEDAVWLLSTRHAGGKIILLP